MEFIYIVILILFFINLYLVYKTKNLEKLSNKLPTIETFETSVIDTINDKYRTDLNAMRNLSNFIKNLTLQSESLNIAQDTIYFKDITINGDLRVNGNVNINNNNKIYLNRDTKFINILPKYMVIGWAKAEIPLGWAICDGNKYKLDDNGIAIKDDLNGTLTPDLKGRFILGAGRSQDIDDNNQQLSERLLGAKGGDEYHKLTIDEIPSHNHSIEYNNWAYSHYKNISENIADGGDPSLQANNNGICMPHNNMPPYYVLTYIMKL